MGGEAGVRSELGKGSSFWVTVKVDPRGSSPNAGRGASAAACSSSMTSRAAATASPPSWGWHASRRLPSAASRKPCSSCTRIPVDLVLADELMPSKGGSDLLSAMRGEAALAKIPFVLLCLFGSDQGPFPTAHQPDATGLKPIRAAALIDLIDQVLTGNLPRETTLAPALRTGPTFRGTRLLLVEDNPVNQRVAHRVLQKLAANVTLANNGAEALERIAEESFDAVLMDCQMPVMDGFTATRRIREMDGKAAAAGACPSSPSPPTS